MLDHVVLISLEDFNSMQQTLHLLGTSKNAERLRESIAEFRAGKTLTKDLLKHEPAEQEKRRKQGCRGKSVQDRLDTLLTSG